MGKYLVKVEEFTNLYTEEIITTVFIVSADSPKNAVEKLCNKESFYNATITCYDLNKLINGNFESKQGFKAYKDCIDIDIIKCDYIEK